MRTLKNRFAVAALGVVTAVALAACSSGSSTGEASGAASGAAAASDTDTQCSTPTTEINVGASPSPHAKILQYIQDNLACDAGLNINTVEYSDYIQPNTALNDGSLDANYFQTVPYLEEQVKQNGFQFDHGAGIHLEPLAIFSSKIKSLDEFPDGGKIGIISDTTNQSRALVLLAQKGFVKLPASGDVNVNTVEKLKNFDFIEVEGPQLVRSLADVDIAAINGNFAQEGGLNIKTDSLAIESTKDNPSLNILVWKSDLSGDKLTAVKKLDEILHSADVASYIEQTWSDGSVIPAEPSDSSAGQSGQSGAQSE